MSSFSHHVLLYLRTLYIVWSLVKRRVTRRLTRFQTMHNVLKNSKTFYNGCGAVAVNFSIYLCSVLYLNINSVVNRHTAWFWVFPCPKTVCHRYSPLNAATSAFVQFIQYGVLIGHFACVLRHNSAPMKIADTSIHFAFDHLLWRYI